jgi:hypothetical protein
MSYVYFFQVNISRHRQHGHSHHEDYGQFYSFLSTAILNLFYFNVGVCNDAGAAY